MHLLCRVRLLSAERISLPVACTFIRHEKRAKDLCSTSCALELAGTVLREVPFLDAHWLKVCQLVMADTFQSIRIEVKDDTKLLDHLKAHASYDWAFWAPISQSSVPVDKRTAMLDLLVVYLRSWSVAAAAQTSMLQVSMAEITSSSARATNCANLCSWLVTESSKMDTPPALILFRCKDERHASLMQNVLDRSDQHYGLMPQAKAVPSQHFLMGTLHCRMLTICSVQKNATALPASLMTRLQDAIPRLLYEVNVLMCI